MANEKSCGAIVFTYENNVRKYVILRGVGIYQGYFGFPKGHMEEGETEQETAIRQSLHKDQRFRRSSCWTIMKR